MIKSTDILRRARPLRGLNPFTREPIFMPKPNSAEVIVGGRSYGELVWSQGRLYLDGNPTVLTGIACQVAQALDAVVEDEDGNPLSVPSDWTLEAALARAAEQRVAATPAGKAIPVLRYPGSYPLEFGDFFFGSSGKKWSTLAREWKLPPRESARVTHVQYDHRLHTVGGREAQEVHEIADEEGWIIFARVRDGVAISVGRGPPKALRSKLKRANRKMPKAAKRKTPKAAKPKAAKRKTPKAAKPKTAKRKAPRAAKPKAAKPKKPRGQRSR